MIEQADTRAAAVAGDLTDRLPALVMNVTAMDSTASVFAGRIRQFIRQVFA